MEKSPGLLYVPWDQQVPQFIQERPAWAAKKRRTTSSWTWLYIIITLGFLFNIWRLSCVMKDYTSHNQLGGEPANATLGFGAIYAVSKNDSPRRAQLERATDLTGLKIKYPAQPTWDDYAIEQVKAEENSTLTKGSALAWLGHLNVLNKFLNSTFETALIVEDDIDFDTHIRTEQIPATANAIREMLSSQQPRHYYGDPSLWDIIWLGHCGDAFDAAQAADLPPIKVFTDTSLPYFEDLLPKTRTFLEGLGIRTEQQRIVHRSVNPLCSFAYAVTRSAAQKLVNEYAAREPSRAAHRPCSAFDVRLLEACRDDGFKCVTVTPELFHHTMAPSEIAAASGEPRHAGGQNDDDYEDTPNIWCSARSELWWDEDSKPTKSGGVLSRTPSLSTLAQKPGSCYLDDLFDD